MKITRIGARANHGQSQINLHSPKFSWKSDHSALTISQDNVKDFSSEAHHFYEVHVSVTDINNLIITLASAAKKNPIFFEQALEPSLKALLQLQHITSGLQSDT